VDGTFYVVPNGFYQLINIAVYDILSNTYIPVLWGLATHKTYELYVQFFWDVAKLLSSIKKIKITVDFEQKLIDALKHIFDCDICGCLYHFSQCLEKKPKNLICFYLRMRKRQEI